MDNLEPVRKLVEALENARPYFYHSPLCKVGTPCECGFLDAKENLYRAETAARALLAAQEGEEKRKQSDDLDRSPAQPMKRRCPKCKKIFDYFGDPECPYCLCPVSHPVEEAHEQP